MFLRLGVLATTFGHATPSLHGSDGASNDCSFKTMDEARAELFASLTRSNAFSLASNEWREALFRARELRQHDLEPELARMESYAEIESRFTSLQSREIVHLKELARWRHAFDRKSSRQTLQSALS